MPARWRFRCGCGPPAPTLRRHRAAELLRRSPVYFATLLPQVQVHHGTADAIVPVGEAERLIRAMQALGRRAPEFESYIYQGGGHDVLSLPGAIERTRTFVGRLVVAGASVASVR